MDGASGIVWAVAGCCTHSVATAGHRGRDQTYQALRRRWYWRGMFRDVQRFVRGCLQCRRRKDSQPVRAGHMVTFNATAPMQDLGVDLVGPLALTDSGNRFVVSMVLSVCRFSMWCEFVAVPDATAETVADVISSSSTPGAAASGSHSASSATTEVPSSPQTSLPSCASALAPTIL